MRWIPFALALGGVSLALGSYSFNPRPAKAGTAVRMEVEDLVDAADRIVEARITGTRSLPDGRGGVVTEYRLQVRRTFFGSATAPTVIRIPGGVLANGRGMVLPGMPRLSVGEEALLFLNGETDCMPTGLAQGKYRIMMDRAGMRRAVRSSGQVELVTAAGEAGGHGGVQALPYAELSARIQARASERTAREAFQGPQSSDR